MDNPFVIIQPKKGLPELPCNSCKSECCSGIPLTQREVNRIVDHLSTLPVQELDRLEAQERDPMACIFVDTEKWRCSVYPARPLMCELYGRVPRMVCSYAPERAQELTSRQSDNLVAAHMAIEDWVCLTAFSFFGKVADVFLTWPNVRKLAKVKSSTIPK